jgi:ferritin-like protein
MQQTAGERMTSETLHAPRERLNRATLTHHQAIVSVMEEMEAVDWYRQRADDCEDANLRDILLHNMREEIEHACMILEWLRRNDAAWSQQMDTYLYTEAPITEIEEEETGGAAAGPDAGSNSRAGAGGRTFTVGTMKGER